MSLNNCGLKSLKNLPILDLIKIELSDNKIPGSELEHLKQYKNIARIKFANNVVSSLKELDSLKSMEHLQSLDLSECSLCNEKDIEKTIFKLFPKLKVFNGKSPDGQSVYSDDEFDDEDGEDDEYDGEDDGDFEGEEDGEEFDEDEDLDEDDEYDDEDEK